MSVVVTSCTIQRLYNTCSGVQFIFLLIVSRIIGWILLLFSVTALVIFFAIARVRDQLWGCYYWDFVWCPNLLVSFMFSWRFFYWCILFSSSSSSVVNAYCLAVYASQISCLPCRWPCNEARSLNLLIPLPEAEGIYGLSS